MNSQEPRICKTDGCSNIIEPAKAAGRPRLHCEQCRAPRTKRVLEAKFLDGGRSVETRSFDDSRVKQFRRDELVNDFVIRHPTRNAPVNILTLCGEHAIQNPGSVENQLLSLYPRSEFILVEKEKRIADKLYAEIKGSADWSAWKKATIICQDVLSFIEHIQGDPSFPTVDLYYLDWMGGYGKDERETVNLILRHRLLAKNGILSITVNTSGRSLATNQETLGTILRPDRHSVDIVPVLTDHILNLGESHNYKMSNRAKVVPYACVDSTKHAHPMVAATFPCDHAPQRVLRAAG